MKQYASKDLRNICMLSHSGAGKTSIAEAMLYLTKAVDRLGKVTDGNTACDFDPEEAKRQISISTSVAPIEWNGVKLNVLDTPGYFDFVGEVLQALSVSDTALIPVSAKSGIGVGTEKAVQYASQKGISKIFFISKLNEEHADFAKVLAALRDKFGSSVVPIVFPIQKDGSVKGYVDLLSGKAYSYKAGAASEMAVPDDAADLVEEYKGMINEAIAETSEELMDKFFSGEAFTADEIDAGMRAALRDAAIMPVLSGTATELEAIDLLMNFLAKYAVSPLEAPAMKTADGEDVSVTPDGPTSAFIFKTVADPYVGKMSYFKVVTGTMKADSALQNATNSQNEKLSHIYVVRGKKQIEVPSLAAGDIGALAKLQFTATSDTLCDAAKPVKYAPIEFPIPMLNLAVTAKKQGEDDKVISGLTKLAEEDPTIRIEKNAETGDVLICGVGEMHIDVACAKLKTKSNVEAQLSDPRIPYRETIRSTAEAEGKHKKQSGGSGQFGVVQMRFEPAAEGTDFEFVNAVVGGAVPKEFIPAVEKGLREALVHGVLAGYPMVGVRATLYDGKYHPVDSKEVAFKSAARLAYKAACVKASPALIEPIYKYEILVPNDNVGDVIGDLNRRRGRMLGMNPVDGGTVVEAEAPLSEMFKYATDLRSMTQGRGSFQSTFVRYEDVPANLAQKIIEQAKLEDDEE